MKKTKHRQLKGIALRDSIDKTVLVEAKILKIHPIYQKRYYSKRKYLVHTEKEIKKGSGVLIEECRPVSKRKAWKVLEVK